jgi:ABC-type iron transport system FetAB permease component
MNEWYAFIIFALRSFAISLLLAWYSLKYLTKFSLYLLKFVGISAGTASVRTGSAVNKGSAEKRSLVSNATKEVATQEIKTNSSTQNSKPLFQANSVVGVANAVVTSYQEGMMKFRYKCDKCGTLGLDEIYTQASLQGHSYQSYKLCHKRSTNLTASKQIN